MKISIVINVQDEDQDSYKLFSIIVININFDISIFFLQCLFMNLD